VTTAAFDQTRGALADAISDIRAVWTHWHTLAAVGVGAAAAAPAFAPGWFHLDGVAAAMYRALAATGLMLAVGLGGMPSLSQGAFMAFGAFGTALLTARAGWPLLPALLVGVAAAAAAGAIAAVGVVRLRPAFIAVTTWILTWLVVIFLLAFPSISGGSQGIVVSRPLSPTVHYELALALLVLAILAAASVARSPAGLELRAASAKAAAASSLGVVAARRRLGAFVASAAVGALAGALAVDLAGVADASDFGPFRSFELFVAVVIGGAASALGPTVGIVALALVAAGGRFLADLEGVQAVRFEPMFASLLLLTVLGLGGVGAVPAARRFLARRERPARPVGTVARPRVRAVDNAALLEARSLEKRFGNIVAADDVSLRVAGGEICALIGPNGSGKTTVLRMLAGTVMPDAGTVLVDGAALGWAPARDRALRGLVRTLQSTSALTGLTALENVIVGAGLRRRYGGSLRTLVASPLARAEDAAVRTAALETLDQVGLAWAADVPADELPGPDQRLVAVAAALATRPRVLLLDEPAAGSSVEEVARLGELLSRMRTAGIAVLLVEHNLRLVRSVADRVVVMAAGRVIAEGLPDEIAAHHDVRAAYLGRRAL
jgi:ABC-type branched-subunit amino acid transport system ATPase component/ABC-type branched-subunit amino acid transport system permease subunit